tara:strand:- start:113 stop:310 length:198 start_codon:yes stop_codon:yes gene_type:complete
LDLIMTQEEYDKFPQEYKEMMKKESRLLTKRQLEILDGAELKSHEGMVFGQMYADWKVRKLLLRP